MGRCIAKAVIYGHMIFAGETEETHKPFELKYSICGPGIEARASQIRRRNANNSTRVLLGYCVR
jgi:hypothetical protein